MAILNTIEAIRHELQLWSAGRSALDVLIHDAYLEVPLLTSSTAKVDLLSLRRRIRHSFSATVVFIRGKLAWCERYSAVSPVDSV